MAQSSIKFSLCATNPCVAIEPWTRPDQVVHHEQLSHHLYENMHSTVRTSEMCKWPCIRQKRTLDCALDRAYVRLHTSLAQVTLNILCSIHSYINNVHTSTGFSGSGSVDNLVLFTRSTMEYWNSFLAIPSTSLSDSSTLLSRIRSSRTFHRSVVLSISVLSR